MSPAPQNPLDPERDLSQTLARQAERFERGGSPLELEQVLSRAGEIRRGRRMRATMVMAAVVLAVAVPVGITTLNENDPTRPDRQNVADVSLAPDTSEVGLGEYKAGGAPKTGYVAAGTLHFDGTERSVGKGNVSYLDRMDGGFLIGQSDDSGNATARFLPDQGDSEQSWDLGSGFAVSAGGGVGVFVETNGSVIAVQDGTGTQVGKLPQAGGYGAIAVVGEDCSSAAAPEDCSIYVSESDETPSIWKVTPSAEPEAVSDRDGLLDVDGAGNYVRQLSYDDTRGGTYGYFDLTGKQLWTTSDYTPLGFSPDGLHLLAGPAYLDGVGQQQVTVLESATGNPVSDLKTTTGPEDGPMVSVFELVWEDDGHVLATVTEGTEVAVLRFDLIGNREYAVPVTENADPYGPAPIRLG